MSDLVERLWTRWSDSRPPNAPGKYRYRVKANILGLDLTPEWTETMSLCGMGYGENEWWPLTLCHWDGYRRQITAPNLEWSEQQETDTDAIIWGGLDLLPCPFTGAAPTVKAQGRYIGAPLWHSEALWISSPSVPQRRFTDAKSMVAAWNRRSPDPELSRLSALVAWQDIETAPKTGEIVDLWCQSPSGGISGGPERVPNCWFYQGYWWTRDEQYGDEFNRRSIHGATHWLPLPAPPVLTTPPVPPTKGPEDDLIAALEKRAKWHKCSCPEPCDDYGVFPGGCAGRYREDYLSLLALRSRPASALPVVKPLEWHKSQMPSWNDDWHTTTPIIYTIRCADENGWKWSFHGGQGYERSAASAKAAAQADYERRILSALTPSVQP